MQFHYYIIRVSIILFFNIQFITPSFSEESSSTHSKFNHTESKNIKLRVKLNDGNVIIGTTSIESFSFKTTVGVLEVKLSDAKRIESNLLELNDGSKMKGDVFLKIIPVSIASQIVSIDFRHVKFIEVGTDFTSVNKSTPENQLNPTTESSASANDDLSRPSEIEARKIFLDKVSSQSMNSAGLVSLKKTNGTSGIENGIPFYIMYVEAIVQFNIKGKWMISDISAAPGFRVTPAPTKNVNQSGNKLDNWGDWRYLATVVGHEVSPGSTFLIEGTLKFEKSENGWLFIGMSWKKVSECSLAQGQATPTTKATSRSGDIVSNEQEVKLHQKIIEEQPLASLLGRPVASQNARTGIYNIKSSKVTVAYLIEDIVERGEKNGIVVCFKQPLEQSTSDNRGTITVTYDRAGMLASVGTMREIRNATKDNFRRDLKDPAFSSISSVTLAGQQGEIFMVVGKVNGHIVQKVVAYSVSSNVLFAVMLHTRPETLLQRWDAYRLVVDSYTSN